MCDVAGVGAALGLIGVGFGAYFVALGWCIREFSRGVDRVIAKRS